MILDVMDGKHANVTRKIMVTENAIGRIFINEGKRNFMVHYVKKVNVGRRIGLFRWISVEVYNFTLL